MGFDESGMNVNWSVVRPNGLLPVIAALPNASVLSPIMQVVLAIDDTSPARHAGSAYAPMANAAKQMVRYRNRLFMFPLLSTVAQTSENGQAQSSCYANPDCGPSKGFTGGSKVAGFRKNSNSSERSGLFPIDLMSIRGHALIGFRSPSPVISFTASSSVLKV